MTTQPEALRLADALENLRDLIATLEAALEQPNADYERGFIDGMSEQAKRSVDRAVNRMADALEQPEQEPVAWLRREELADLQTCNYRRLGADSPRIWAPHQADTPTPEEGLVPVFTQPPRREWRGLKEWEINDGLDQLPTEDVCSWSFRKGVYFAEAALKEKNQ